ncbi:hypothetical protein ACLOJK_001564 [Asimina triloba]
MASDASAKKLRKPYTITKSRESWTEEEHDKFLEALQLFDRDWKKIEDFVGSKTVIQVAELKYSLRVLPKNVILQAARVCPEIQGSDKDLGRLLGMIRSHAQKYFLKVQRNGIVAHVPPPRPKRKATHPYPQKAPKNVSAPYLSTSSCVSPPWDDASMLLNNSSSVLMPSQGMPDFAEVYNFIGGFFDPSTKDHKEKLKEMTPINIETVLLLMRNLIVNLSSPDFEHFVITSYSIVTISFTRVKEVKVIYKFKGRTVIQVQYCSALRMQNGRNKGGLVKELILLLQSRMLSVVDMLWSEPEEAVSLRYADPQGCICLLSVDDPLKSCSIIRTCTHFDVSYHLRYGLCYLVVGNGVVGRRLWLVSSKASVLQLNLGKRDRQFNEMVGTAALIHLIHHPSEWRELCPDITYTALIVLSLFLTVKFVAPAAAARRRWAFSTAEMEEEKPSAAPPKAFGEPWPDFNDGLTYTDVFKSANTTGSLFPPSLPPSLSQATQTDCFDTPVELLAAHLPLYFVRKSFHGVYIGFNESGMGRVKLRVLTYVNPQITVDGQVVTDPDITLRDGSTLLYSRLPWREPDAPHFLEILYEDDDMIAINKPSGLQVLPGGLFQQRTVLTQLQWLAEKRSSCALKLSGSATAQGSSPGAAPVHRLGRGTSGILLCAKTKIAKNRLSAYFADGIADIGDINGSHSKEIGKARKISKIYRAVATGIIDEDEVLVKQPIGMMQYRGVAKGLYVASSSGYLLRLTNVFLSMVRNLQGILFMALEANPNMLSQDLEMMVLQKTDKANDISDEGTIGLQMQFLGIVAITCMPINWFFITLQKVRYGYLNAKLYI